MNPEDISKFYYCFTVSDFYGTGRLYKYLQKAVTKLIKRFETQNLRLMFTSWDDERMRLNTGVRGRLTDRLFFLMDRKEMDGADVKYIYDQTYIAGER